MQKDTHIQARVSVAQTKISLIPTGFRAVPVTFQRRPLSTPLALNVVSSEEIVGQKRQRSESEASICGLRLPVRSTTFTWIGATEQKSQDVVAVDTAQSAEGHTHKRKKNRGGKAGKQSDALVSPSAPSTRQPLHQNSRSSTGLPQTLVSANAVFLSSFSNLTQEVQFVSKKTGAVYPRVRNAKGEEVLVLAKGATDEIDAIAFVMSTA
eukprot:GILI01027898.1.p1 GENE.GILI01027898.1~~GILI01027898.1.p1  ORF type:complete len:209 (-),score=23.57 GILI01027898.1:92-718(-)